MRESQGKPEIADAVRLIMPDASEDELIEATENFRGFLKELYDIYMERNPDSETIEEIFAPKEE